MKLLQSLLSENFTKKLRESAEDFDEAFDSWCNHTHTFHFEGDAGLHDFDNLVNELDYSNMDTFLEDNSGAIEAIIEWVKNQRSPEWLESLKSNGGEGSDISDAVDALFSARDIYNFEGRRGTRALTVLAQALGYHGLDYFFSDNSGAFEAIIDWMRELNNPEWTEKLDKTGEDGYNDYGDGGEVSDGDEDEVDEAKKQKDADEVTDDPEQDPEGEPKEPKGKADAETDADPLLQIATTVFGIADWDEESHQDASGKKLKKALQAAFDAGAASVTDAGGKEDKAPKGKAADQEPETDLEEGAITTGLKVKVADLPSHVRTYFEELDKSAIFDLLDEFMENNSELTLEDAKYDPVSRTITFVPHFGDTIEPKDHSRIIGNLAEELGTFAFEYVENESRRVVKRVTGALKMHGITARESVVQTWLLGGGMQVPVRFIQELEDAFPGMTIGKDDETVLKKKLGINNSEFSLLVAASL